MVRGNKTLYFLLGLAAIASACSSNDNDDSAAHGGTSAGGTSAGGTTADAGHAGGGAANAGTHAGGNANHGGSNAAAGPDAGANAGASAGADEMGGEAGTPSGGTNGEAGAAGSENAGAAGTSEGQLETAYVAGFLGGIISYSLDPKSGAPTALGPAIDDHAAISALAVEPTQRFLYVVDQRGTVDTFAIGTDGALSPTPKFSTTVTGDPITLALAPSGKFAYVGSTDGTNHVLTVLALDADTGEPTVSGTPLPVDSVPAYLALSPNGKFAYLTAQINVGLWAYRVDPTSGALEAITGSPFGSDTVFRGALAFTPNSAFLYTTGSDLTNTGAGLNGFKIGENGAPERIGTQLLQSDEFSDPSAKNIAIDPSGKHLYVSQFLGEERMFEFSINASDGTLAPLTTPSVSLTDPYACDFDPSGRFLYVGQDTGTISVFEPSAVNGTLAPIEGSPFMPSLPQPVLAFSRRAAPPAQSP